MKPEYAEGIEIAGKFEETMKLLFQTPKASGQHLAATKAPL